MIIGITSIMVETIPKIVGVILVAVRITSMVANVIPITVEVMVEVALATVEVILE